MQGPYLSRYAFRDMGIESVDTEDVVRGGASLFSPNGS